MIAIQFARGGDTARAAEYAEKGRRSRRIGPRIPSRGAILFHRSVTGRVRPRPQGHLCERLANAHAAAGRGAEAAAAYLRAAESAGSDEAKSALRRQAAEQWIQRGNVREGVRVLTSLGAEYDIRHTDSLVRALISIQWSRVLAEGARAGLSGAPQRGCGAAGPGAARRVLGSYRGPQSLESSDRDQIPTEVSPECLPGWRTAAGGAWAGYRGFYVTLAGESAYPRARSILGRALAVGTRLNDPRIVERHTPWTRCAGG